MLNYNIKKYIVPEPSDAYYLLKSRPEGLKPKEVSDRQEQYGKNELNGQRKFIALKIFISQFQNPLIVILLLATIISGFLGEYFSAIIICVMVFVSAILAFYQEYNSEKIIQALKNKVALRASVIRNGKIREINTSELVVGDVVLLHPASVIPADLRLVETGGLAVNQAVLTGESFPVEKNAQAIKKCRQIFEATNLAFAGSHVVQGSGKGVVTAIGSNTFFGQTAKLLAEAQAPSQFQKGIAQFGYFLFKIIILFSFAVFLILAVAKGNWLEALLFSLAIAVGISPELLPVIITINLSRGARAMAGKFVIVKRLMAIENLGNADVLCTDKTGTLTEGKIELKDYLDFDGNKNEKILMLGRLCNSYAVDRVSSRNILDLAIFNYADKLRRGVDGNIIKDIIPFDFYRRRMSVIIEKDKNRELVCKGASEEILSVCGYIAIGGKIKNISDYLGKINEQIRALESSGYRLLLVARKKIEEKEKYTVADESGLILEGILTFIDPPKKTAASSISLLNGLGVTVKILTGDNEFSAKRLCQDIGFSYTKILLGADIEKMSDAKLTKAVLDTDIYAKVTPEHKLRIVKALKARGHNVAFLGDGVNDAPALRAADVGISVDSAVDVAREAADVILLKKSLAVMIEGIKEGRKTFGNTLKYIFCTISSNYGNMFTVVGAALFLPFIPMLPVQIILLNFLSDIPMLAISSDKVDEEYLKKPKQWDIKKIRKSMNYFGLLSSLMDYVTFGFLIFILNAPMALFHAGWFWQSFLTEVLLIFVIRTRRHFWKSRPSGLLIATSVIATLLVCVIMFTPFGQIFGFAVLKFWQAGVIIIISVLYFVMVEFLKKHIYKKLDF